MSNEIGEYMAIDIHKNKVVYRGAKEECLTYCNNKIRLYGAILEKKQALTLPTQEEVCDELNKEWNLPHENSSLHFIYNSDDKEFQMVDKNNKVWRYISFERETDYMICLNDLKTKTARMVSQFYERLDDNE